jgi:arginyl-tRNA synthetase
MDNWYSERHLADDGLIDRALERLAEKKVTYRKGGALWFRASDFGDDKDRVLVRANGQKTYIASDIAYHYDKRVRGYDLLLDVLGSDHHGYVARVRAGLQAMGEPGDSLEVRLMQFVTLYRDGRKVQMTTRGGDYVTLRELRSEVGNDAARFFYVMRSNDQHLDFDLDLAKARREENPVFYIQYAHARIASVFAKLREQGHSWDEQRGRDNLSLLADEKERALLRELARYPEIVWLAARRRAPQTIVNFLNELTGAFHSFYNACKVITEDDALRDSRLCLIQATRITIANGLALLGVSAPENM